MNKNGKSNMLFLLLIPLFFGLAIIIVDTFFSYTQNKNLKHITEKIIKEVIEDDEIEIDEYAYEIKRRYEMNNIDVDSLIVDASEYEVNVANQHRYFGLFSSLTNEALPEIEVSIIGLKFKLKKGSVAIINVTARENSDKEIQFEYSK